MWGGVFEWLRRYVFEDRRGDGVGVVFMWGGGGGERVYAARVGGRGKGKGEHWVCCYCCIIVGCYVLLLAFGGVFWTWIRFV